MNDFRNDNQEHFWRTSSRRINEDFQVLLREQKLRIFKDFKKKKQNKKNNDLKGGNFWHIFVR